MDCIELTKNQALLTVNDHLGEVVSVELYVIDQRGERCTTLLALRGRLRRLYDLECMGSMPEWERDAYEAVYMLGDQLMDLASGADVIALQRDGLDFHLADDVIVLSMIWDERDLDRD